MKFSHEPDLRRGPRLSEQVANFLATEIEKGAFRSGDSLSTEAELCYRFNVSRTVIREALARLKQDDILESKQGCRTKVIKSHNKRKFSLTALVKKKYPAYDPL